MPIVDQVQLAFAGVNPVGSPEKLQESDCATATNIDFSVEPGAAAVRMGCAKRFTVGTGPIYALWRRYTNNLGDLSPFYIRSNDVVYRGSSTFTAIDTLGSIDNRTGLTSYQGKTFVAVANASKCVSDNGTQVSDWVIATPSGPPGINVPVNTSSLAPTATATFTLIEGTSSGTATTMIEGGTATCDPTTFRLTASATLTTTNLEVIGTASIGPYGYDSINFKFSNPAAVTRIIREYSVGDTSFNARYWGTLDNINSLPAYLDPVLGYYVTDRGVTNQPGRRFTSPQNGKFATSIIPAKNTYATWVMPRQTLTFEPGDATLQPSGWTNIKAVRITIEASSQITASFDKWKIWGDADHPLNDQKEGYHYWETFAEVSSGNIINESPPSAVSTAVRCQAGQATITSTLTYTGAHQPTSLYRVYYRQGGLIYDAYRLGSVAYSATNTYIDKQDDLTLSMKGPDALLNFDTDDLPNNVVCVSEPFYDRIVVGYINQISWSLPGLPGVFPPKSNTAVSHLGDEVYGLVVWPPGMIIVNRDSIYEWHGSNFEGDSQDWVLQRTGAGRGSKASRTIIKTPYGVPILDYDGIYMYQPGQGVETPIGWAMDILGDAFRSAIVTIKGNRTPSVNKGYIFTSCAAWAYNKLYIGVPTGSATTPNTIFVLDFATKKAWWYTYSYNFTSMFYNFAEDELLVGSTDGTIYSIENQLADVDSSGTLVPITWKVRTRTWTSPSDARLENISVEGAGTATVKAIYDSTSTVTLGTLTNTSKDWNILPLTGSIANNVFFELSGTAADASNRSIFTALSFDAIVEPPQVRYFHTEPVIPNVAGESLFDVHYATLDAIGTGTVTATVFVDNAAVMTATITASASAVTNGPLPKLTAFPAETYGKVSYTIYTCSTGLTFKHYNTRVDARPEPPRINYWKSDLQSLDEAIIDAFDVDINPNGTVTAVTYIDNTAVTTSSIVGTNRQSYTTTIPNETYGRTLYVTYAGSSFKHYNTWWHRRPEPDRWTNYVSDKQQFNGEEICDSWVAVVNPLGGSVIGTAMIDGTAAGTATITGTNKVNVVTAIPNETYGRIGYVIYNAVGTGKFKHYLSSFNTRQEPDRVSNFVSDKQGGNEHEWKTFEAVTNCLNNTVLAIVYVDGTIVGTYTLTGNDFLSKTFSLPADTYGRSIWASYTVSGGGKFKHYNTHFDGVEEPDRHTSFHIGPIVYPSGADLRTWVTELNPLSGTAIGTFYIDGTAALTSTFTGARRTSFDTSVDILAGVPQTGTAIDIYYTGGPFKHYKTDVEMTPRPFAKRSWSIRYNKPGGASQLDMPRFWSYDIEVPASGTATITSIWDVDGSPFLTSTMTVTGRQYVDRIPFGPGGRGFLHQQRMASTSEFRVWRSTLDFEQIGVKNLSRRTVRGVPVPDSNN